MRKIAFENGVRYKLQKGKNLFPDSNKSKSKNISKRNKEFN